MAASSSKRRRSRHGSLAKRRQDEYKRLLVVEFIVAAVFPMIVGFSYFFGILDVEPAVCPVWILMGEIFQAVYILYTVYRIKNKSRMSRWNTVIYVNYWVSVSGLFIAVGCQISDSFLGSLVCMFPAFLFMIAAIGNIVDLIAFYLMYAFSVLRMNTHHEISLQDNIYIGLIVILCGIAYWYRTMVALQREKDVTEIKTATTQAETDPMTKLLNRRGMQSRMRLVWPQCIRDEKQVAVIMLDIDFFKVYNDTFGHLQGDECIRLVANKIAKHTRRETDFAARIGGEEFLVFLNGAGPKQALTWAKDLKEDIEDERIPHAQSNFLPFVTVSIGIHSERVRRGVDFFELQDKADRSLYEAKDAGRACICISGDIYAKTERKTPNSDDGMTAGFRPLD